MNLQNFIRLELDALITDSATSMTVQDPVAPFKEPFNPTSGVATVVLTDNEWNPTKFEVITYTGAADNGDGTWTLSGLSRGQENTTAQEWDAGSIVTQPLTAGAMSEFSVVSGNVGIGTANPSEKLHVNGNAYVVGTGRFEQTVKIVGNATGDESTARVDFYDSNGVRKGFVGDASVSSPSIWLQAEDNNHVLLNAVTTGKVAIGHGLPTERLDVNGNIKADTAKLENGLYIGADSGQLRIGGGGEGASGRSYFSPRNQADDDWLWGHEFGFHAGNSCWYIDSALAIGSTDDNGYKLHVTGDICVTGEITNNTGWLTTGVSNCKYRKMPDGTVELRTTADSSSLGTLPSGYRPAQVIRFMVLGADNSTTVLTISTDGSISVFSSVKAGAVVRFYADGS